MEYKRFKDLFDSIYVELKLYREFDLKIDLKEGEELINIKIY